MYAKSEVRKSAEAVMDAAGIKYANHYLGRSVFVDARKHGARAKFAGVFVSKQELDQLTADFTARNAGRKVKVGHTSYGPGPLRYAGLAFTLYDA